MVTAVTKGFAFLLQLNNNRVNVPFLQTATFTGLVSTDNYLTSQEWSDAYNISTTYQTSSGNFVSTTSLNEISGLLLPVTQYQETSGNWQNTYTNVQSNSSNWNIAYNIATFYSQNSAILIEQTTFSTLTSLKLNNQLKPGQLYQINDFQLMWWNLGQNFIQVLSSTIIEPLIVQAITSDKIAAEALSVLHPDDIVYYDIDARTSTTWSAGPSNIPNFKGWIYRRIDLKKNIDIAWDWRYITHNCCRYDIYTAPLYIPNTTYNRGSLVRSPALPNRLYISLINNNTSSGANPTTSNWRLVTNQSDDSLVYYPTIEAGVGTTLGSNFFENVLSLSPILSTRAQFYTFTDSITTPTSGSDLTTKPNINNIKINGPGSYHIIFDCRNNNNMNFNSFTIDLNSRNNIFSVAVISGASNTRFGGNLVGNTVFSLITNNLFGDNFQYNCCPSLGNMQFNNISTGCSRNIFGFGPSQQFLRNFIKDNCSGNYFQSTQNNTIGDNFQNNTVFSFSNNVVGNSVTGNIFSSGTQLNRIGDSFQNNTLGTNFQSNIIDNSCNNNTLGSSFSFNTVGSNFDLNNIGTNCIYNNFGGICQSNTLSSFFQYNNTKNDFSFNNIDVSFYENQILNSFTNNTIGTNFHSNYISSNFQNNIIENNFNNTDIGDEIQAINFTGATHVYNTYDKTIFKNSNLIPRLSYYNSSDQLVVTDPTA